VFKVGAWLVRPAVLGADLFAVLTTDLTLLFFPESANASGVAAQNKVQRESIEINLISIFRREVVDMGSQLLSINRIRFQLT
jgi:hypothetical protein